MKKITNFILISCIIFYVYILFSDGIRLIKDLFFRSRAPLPLGYAIIEVFVKLLMLMGPVIMFLLAATPYVILLIFNKKYEKKIIKDITVLITTIIISTFGIILTINVLFIHPDPQSGIVFIYLAPAQIVVSFILIAVGYGIEWLIGKLKR